MASREHAHMKDHPQRWATSDDLRRILGDLDDPKVLEILDLAPSVADVEQAMLCLADDDAVLVKDGRQVSAVARRIAKILTSDEEDEHLREP